MDIGAYILPGLALTILFGLIYVTAAWVYDGSKPEEDVDIPGPPERPAPPAPPPKRGTPGAMVWVDKPSRLGKGRIFPTE